MIFSNPLRGNNHYLEVPTTQAKNYIMLINHLLTIQQVQDITFMFLRDPALQKIYKYVKYSELYKVFSKELFGSQCK